MFLIGTAAFMLNPALCGRLLAIAADAPALAGANTVSAFRPGIGITPVPAAVSLAQGAALAAAAVPPVLLDRARRNR